MGKPSHSLRAIPDVPPPQLLIITTKSTTEILKKMRKSDFLHLFKGTDLFDLNTKIRNEPQNLSGSQE